MEGYPVEEGAEIEIPLLPLSDLKSLAVIRVVLGLGLGKKHNL
jgi:hypothetical protein